jgi:hypothetical protein
LKRPALLLAALLGLFLLPSPALAVPPWSQRYGALCLLCPSHVDANGNNDLESAAVRCTAGQGDDSYLTARAGRFIPNPVWNDCNGLMASAFAPLMLTDAPLSDRFFTLGRVEKSPWGFAIRASETGLTGGRAVAEAERRRKYGIYSNSVLIGFRWAF